MDKTAEQGFAAARYTGASNHIGVFEIDGDRMRAAEAPPGTFIKWGYCNPERLLTPVLPTVEAVRAILQEQSNATER